MKRGIALIEVLVALFLCMILFAAAARLSLTAIRGGADAEARTYASVMGHSKLSSLLNLPYTAAELEPRWHADPGNPLRGGRIPFYRFWQVDGVEGGKRVVLFVAWDSGSRTGAEDLGSLADAETSGCPKVSFRGILLLD